MVSHPLKVHCNKVACEPVESPDALTLVFFLRKKETPKDKRVVLFAEPLKSLEKEGNTHTQEKARKIRKLKEQGTKRRIGGPGSESKFTIAQLKCALISNHCMVKSLVP